MLSRDEERELAAIERRLQDQDPGLARRLARGPSRGAGLRWWALLLAAMSTPCLLIGLVTGNGAAFVGGIALFWLAARLTAGRPFRRRR